MVTATKTQNDAALKAEFERLVEEWKAGRRPSSSAAKLAAHPAYQQIIALGKSDTERVVPLLLVELEQNPDHWFIALHAVTGADPVPASARGRLKEMAAAWVSWWEEQHGGKR